MCGIAGIYQAAGRLSDPEPHLKNMLSAIQYRGPDEVGLYINKKAALGSVRLSIIDLKSGQQPLCSEDGNYWIIFNGEIFNYIELKSDLVKRGHRFRTDSDTEVLLHAYMEYGPNCLDLLNGQFALAIWSNRDNELFLARDRVGIRPLFYTTLGDTFVFASEIKAILEYPSAKTNIDLLSLLQVFTYWTTVPPNTVFKNILELPPGHCMILSNHKKVIKKYWSLEFPSLHEQYFQGSLQDAKEQLDFLLTDAVRIRLRADVPVAAYLSGGLDSSTTTSLIKRVSPELLQTFSVGFEDEEFDETAFQSELSDFLETRHISFSCSKEDIGAYFPQVIWHTEIPILRTAPVPMFCLSKKVREHQIKVVMTGEGADEMIAGYGIFKEAVIREFWSHQPDSKYRPLLFNKLYPYLAQFQGKNKSLLRLFYGYRLMETDSPFYSHLLRWHNAASLHQYFSPEFKASINDVSHEDVLHAWLPKGFGNYDRLGKAQWLESFLFMSGYLLSSQGDRMAMANSVEGRYPFLDKRVIEFCASLPPGFKMNGLNEKYILKRMMEGKLPESILRRPKQAYRAPVATSFFTSSAQHYIIDLLNVRELNDSGLFSPSAVARLIDKTKNSRLVTEMENMALSGIISTQLLYHQFILRDRFQPLKKEIDHCRVYYENNPAYT